MKTDRCNHRRINRSRLNSRLADLFHLQSNKTKQKGDCTELKFFCSQTLSTHLEASNQEEAQKKFDDLLVQGLIETDMIIEVNEE